MATSIIVFFRADGVSLLGAPGGQLVLAAAAGGAYAGRRFIPQHAYICLRAMSGGALTTSPGFRIGTNVNHNNVAPIYIPPTSIVVGAIGEMPLTSPLVAPPIDTADLIAELTQSAVGPTVMTADLLLEGLLVG